MRVNVYAEEMTRRVEIVTKRTADGEFTGVRFYLELPATVVGAGGATVQTQGPFIHRPGDDDSAAVTFWGKRELRHALMLGLAALNDHEAAQHGNGHSFGSGPQAGEFEK